MRDANGRSHRPAGMPGAGRFESEADDSDLDVEPTPEAVLPRLLRTDNAQYPYYLPQTKRLGILTIRMEDLV